MIWTLLPLLTLDYTSDIPNLLTPQLLIINTYKNNNNNLINLNLINNHLIINNNNNNNNNNKNNNKNSLFCKNSLNTVNWITLPSNPTVL